MRSELYDAVEEATRNEFELVAQLGGGAAWAAFLGRPLAGRGPLAILLLQAADDDDGEFDLETVEALDEELPLGRTTCPSCGGGGEGWPRFCPACGADLTGVPADAAVPGGSARELLEEVRGAAAGVYEVLGAMPHAEGGGALYFAREAGTGRVVGLVLRHEADGDLDLALSWTPEEEGESGGVLVDTAEPVPAAAVPDAFTLAPPAAVPAPDVPALFAEEPADSRRPFFAPPPGRGRDRSRGGAPRALGIAAAIVGVSLVAAVVLAIQDPPTPDVVPDTLARGEAVAPVGPGPADPSLAATDTAAGAYSASAPTDGAGGPLPDPRPEPDLSSRPPVSGGAASPGGSTAAGPSPSTTQAPSGTGGAGPSTAATAPVTGPASAPAAAPTPQGIADAVGRYAAAVQSRQTSRISRAYPGITPPEVDRWERFFRPLGPDAGLEARYDVLSGPTVSGTRGEILFTLTMTYTNAAGKRVVSPLPLRGILEWTSGGWSLSEVRSYP